MRRLLFPALVTICLFGSMSLDSASAVASTATAAPESKTDLKGVVKDGDGTPIAGAVVRLECSSLSGPQETKTNARGLYRFASVPADTCTVTVLAEGMEQSKVSTLTDGRRARLGFTIESGGDHRRVIQVEVKSKAVGRTVSMEEFRNIPVGRSHGRDFTQVVESSASASRDSAGISIAGTTGVSPAPVGNREGYAHIQESEFVSPLDHPLSTFAADVDTASYSNVRRFITQGQLPPADAVRVEELINYFEYDYVTPKGDKPVTVNWEVAGCPWNEDHYLARVGLQTRPIADEAVPPRNLVFLLDVSGSMSSPDKLPLLQRAMQLLVDNMRSEDRVSIVVYAGSAGVVLPPTGGDDRTTIRDAINRLESGGSTNGAEGIHLAYRLARKSFVRGGINRVILATDGDFNVGTSSDGELVRLIEKKRKSGVSLSVLGFGQGNLQDSKMEQLADHGDGNYAYIDSVQEARKVLVEEAGATLMTVAKDVKIQVEFNPAKVASYRLIGYENRLLADEDFDDDTKDAGEMGAGHSVTALYEITPAKAEGAQSRRKVKRLRYQKHRALARRAADGEWMTVAVRYKPPTSKRSKRFEVQMRGRPQPFDRASSELRFAAAVAAYGMELRGSKERGTTSLRMVRSIAMKAKGHDLGGYRAAFVDLVKQTAQIRDGLARAEQPASGSRTGW